MIKLDIDSDIGQSNQAFAKNDSTYHSENVNDHLNIINHDYLYSTRTKVIIIEASMKQPK